MRYPLSGSVGPLGAIARSICVTPKLNHSVGMAGRAFNAQLSMAGRALRSCPEQLALRSCHLSHSVTEESHYNGTVTRSIWHTAWSAVPTVYTAPVYYSTVH